MDKRPIGIFDSGVGGLTVCKAIKNILPKENIIYFGDTQRFPYGTRAIETVIRYSREITAYMTSRDVKMIVVACNTASAVALDILKAENTIPIIGVIDAGSKAACKKVTGNKIGIIATRATVKSESYVKAINSISSGYDIVQQHATIFVSLVEEGWTDDEITMLTARKYIQKMYDDGVRTLILGCTHFPMLKKAINTVYPDLNLIDSGEEVALQAKSILNQNNIANLGSDGPGKISLFASDITDTIEQLKNMFFGEDSIYIEKLIIESKE